MVDKEEVEVDTAAADKVDTEVAGTEVRVAVVVAMGDNKADMAVDRQVMVVNLEDTVAELQATVSSKAPMAVQVPALQVGVKDMAVVSATFQAQAVR